jgi:DNA-binding CsgD family transcriptional regulator
VDALNMCDELLVGRRDELACLGRLLAGVVAGAGAAVLVEGEQGIGKTSLLRRALGGAEAAGCALAWGAADELTQPFPLWLMTECLRAWGRMTEGGVRRGGDDSDGANAAGPPLPAGRLAVVPGLVPPGDPVAAGIERVLEEMDRWCVVSPVVLVAEDLQWADEGSLLVWQRLARVVGQLPLLLVGSARPGPGVGEVDRLRRGLLSRGGTVLSLGPLGAREVSELAGRLAGGRPGRRLAGVVRSAAGNPLYAQELVDALVRAGRVRVDAGVAELAGSEAADVPASLAGVIEQRLGVLPEAMAGVLRWAAVLGAEFSVTDLAVVTGWTPDQLMGLIDDAVTAGVFGDPAGPEPAGAGLAATARPSLTFRHGLIRQVLYDALPGALRAALHVQAARALAEAGAAPERVAAQLAVVPEWADGWALEWLAGAVSVLTYRAPDVAADLLGRALGLLPHGDERREALEAALVTVAFVLMRDEEVIRAGGRLAVYARDPDRAAEAAWRVGYAQQRTWRPEEAVASVDKALQRPGISDVWAARLHALHALAMSFAGRLDTPQAARHALALAEAAGDRLAAGYALYTMSLIDFYLRRGEAALRRIDQALNLIGNDPQATELALMLLFRRTQALHELDRHSEAGATIGETLALAERTRTPRLAEAYVLAAGCHFRVGQWDEAVLTLEQAMPLPNAPEGRVLAYGLMALIAGHRDGAKAAEHLAAAEIIEIDSYSIGFKASGHFLLLAQALTAERAGRPGDAVAVLRPDIDPACARSMLERFLFLPDLVRLALAAGDAATAAAAAHVAAQEAELEPLPVKAAAADRCRGLVGGDPAPVLAAAAYYQSASRPLERAQSLEDAAVLLARRGEMTAARRAAAEAVVIYRGLGARWDITRSQARLSSYGIRLTPAGRQARSARGWEALTPTEVKVARLIGDGLSNPDIAARLFLSRNTVQTHVSHILAKLSARSRIEIVRQSLDHPAATEETRTA